MKPILIFFAALFLVVNTQQKAEAQMPCAKSKLKCVRYSDPPRKEVCVAWNKATICVQWKVTKICTKTVIVDYGNGDKRPRCVSWRIDRTCAKTAVVNAGCARYLTHKFKRKCIGWERVCLK